MKVWLFVLLAFGVAFGAGSNITVLEESTFSAFIEANPYVFVDFFVPWCSYCKEIEPILEFTAGFCKDNGIPFVFAKIDVNAAYQLRKKLKIFSYPTLRVYVKGNAIPYRKEAGAAQIIDFLNLKLSSKVKKLTTLDSIQSLSKEKGLRSILISDNAKVLAEYEKAALESSTLTRFFYTSESLGKQAYPEVKTCPSVVLLKDYGEPREVLRPSLGKNSLKRFLKDKAIPFVGTASVDLVDQFLQTGAEKKGVVFFRSAENNTLDKEFGLLRKKTLNKEIVFVIADAKTETEKSVATHLKLGVKDFPALVIAYYENNDLHRYVYKGKFDADSMYHFYSNWKAGKAERTYASAEIPGTQNSEIMK